MMIFFLYFTRKQNLTVHRTLSGDNLHKMSNPVSGENKKKRYSLLKKKVPRVLSVNVVGWSPAISHSDAFDVFGLCWSHRHIALFTYRNTAITLSIETGIKGKRKVQGVPQSQTAALPRPRKRKPTNLNKHKPNKPVQSPILIIISIFIIAINHIYCIWTVLIQILVIILKKKVDEMGITLRIGVHEMRIITKTRLFKYIENFTSKNWKFSDKILWYVSYFCSKYRLLVLVRTASVLLRVGSNEYPQSIFLSRNKKNNVYPSKPQFYYIKVGFKVVKII